MSTVSEQQIPLFQPDSSTQVQESTELEGSFRLTDTSQEEPKSEFSKYIVYVDESGDHSLQSIDENYPIFVLAFCVCHKKHYSDKIVPALENFKFKHFGHDQIVLHEREIRKGEGVFKILSNRKKKHTFLNELTSIIDQNNFILISCTINKNDIPKPSSESNPYHTALGFCLETLYSFLDEKNENQKTTHIVFECRGKKEDRELELEFRRICDSNRLGVKFPFDAIFSEKKVMSSGLQLADLVARPIGMKTLRPEQENRAFEALMEKFYCKGGRDKIGINFEGLGMKIYPTPESKKPR